MWKESLLRSSSTKGRTVQRIDRAEAECDQKLGDADRCGLFDIPGRVQTPVTSRTTLSRS